MRDGAVAVTLDASDYAAGDNYVVEASTDAEFRTGTVRSATYTVWKQVHLSVNKMFRRGGFLAEAVSPGATELIVNTARGWPEPPFQIRLIHGPSMRDGSRAFWEETVTVRRRVGERLILAEREGDVIVGDVVRRSYEGPETVQGQGRYYLADAVGVITGNRENDFFLPNLAALQPTLADAFIDVVVMSDDGDGATGTRIHYDGAIPRDRLIGSTSWGTVELNERHWYTAKWTPTTSGTGMCPVSDPNHFVLFAVDEVEEPGNDNPRALTTVSDGLIDCWFGRGEFRAAAQAEAMVHEFAHLFRVNHRTPTDGTTGHCDVMYGAPQMISGTSSAKCTMTAGLYEPGEDAGSDGVIGFHYYKDSSSSQPQSEYLDMRHRSEPVPANELSGYRRLQ